MIKKFVMLVLLIPALSLLAQEKTNIAVLDLKGENISASDTEIISARLRSELVGTEKYNVIEREKMKDLLKEQGIQISGLVSDSSIVRAGKLLGVKRMAAGTAGKIGNLYTISLRLIDVETGKIIKTASADNTRGIENFLTESVKSASRRLAGLESVPLKNNFSGPSKKGMSIAKPRLSSKRTQGTRRPKNFQQFRERLQNAPPEIKQAAKEVFITDKKIRELEKTPRKNPRQRKELVKLKKRREILFKKIREWEKKD